MGARRDKFHNDILNILANGDRRLGVTLRDLHLLLRCSFGRLYPALYRLSTSTPPLIEGRWEGQPFPSEGEQPVVAHGNDPHLRYYRLVPSRNEDSFRIR